MMMERAEYNRLVQDMQEFCIAAGLEHRINPSPALTVAEFQVYYDGWNTIGSEYNPMTPDCRRTYNEDADAILRARVAQDISV